MKLLKKNLMEKFKTFSPKDQTTVGVMANISS